MLLESLILIGYGVAMGITSSYVRKSCNAKAIENANEKIANLSEDHTIDDENKIIKAETNKAIAKYAIITGALGVGSAYGVTKAINALVPDQNVNTTPKVSSDDEPAIVFTEVSEDGSAITETYEDGTTVTSF